MKLLLITSGYKGIYNYYETWIVNELKKKHELKLFHCQNGLSALQSLTNSFKPNAALTLVGFKLPFEKVEWLKKQKVKTAVWFTEDPYYMDRTKIISRFYDFVFTIDSAPLDFYKVNGHKHAYHFPLATEPEVFYPKPIETKYSSDICLLGFPYPDRIKYIQFLLRNTPYRIRVVGQWRNCLNLFRQNKNLTIHEEWVEPAVAANYYNGAKIVLNTHRPFNLRQNKNGLGIAGKSINNRTFDVAACGTFQLIEFKEDLPSHFIEDEEMVTFRSDQELIQKLDYYIPFEEERKRIATNARNRVLREHTFAQRLEEMLRIIENSPL
jgi:spore maturation protein CgeB